MAPCRLAVRWKGRAEKGDEPRDRQNRAASFPRLRPAWLNAARRKDGGTLQPAAAAVAGSGSTMPDRDAVVQRAGPVLPVRNRMKETSWGTGSAETT